VEKFMDRGGAIHGGVEKFMDRGGGIRGWGGGIHG
jgi:hypothetical protein